MIQQKFPTIIQSNGESSLMTVTCNQHGRNAGMITFSFSIDGNEKSFRLLSSNEVIELAEFLIEQTRITEKNITQPCFDITGYVIKVMCGSREIQTVRSMVIDSVNPASITYESLCSSFPRYANNDFYFIIYALKDGGMNESTIQKIVRACIDYQIAFIVTGDARVSKPMTQKVIEDLIGYDTSTISRAVKGTLIVTSKGYYSLDSSIESNNCFCLFNEGIMCGGTLISSLVVKYKIIEIIDTEDKKNPLSDQQIVENLKKYDYDIARRTVNKYREALKIPNSRERFAQS